MGMGPDGEQAPPTGPVIGISLPVSAGDGRLDAEVLRATASRADALGFGNLSCGDHLLWHTAILDAFIAATMVASSTARATVMTGVALAPLRHPLWTIKMANTLAHLSQGRFVLGLGSGGEVAAEFAALGVDMADRGPLTDEVISLAREHLGAGPAPQLDGLVLGPGLEHRVPVWLAGRGGRALHRVAREADGWLGLFQPIDRFARVAIELRERAAAERTRGSRLACGIQLFICVDDSRGRALARARAFVSSHFGRMDPRLESHLVVGPASEVAEVVERYVAAGADFVQFHLIGGGYLEALDTLSQSLGRRLPSPTLMDLTAANARVPVP